MTPEKAHEILHAFWVGHFRNRDRINAIPYTPEELANARRAYDHVKPNERRSAFHALDRFGVKLGEMPPPVSAFFRLGEGDHTLIVPGYDNGRRWNGWACPMLPRASVVAFAAWIGNASGSLGCCEAGRWEIDHDTVCSIHDPDCADTEIFEPEMVAVVENAPTATRGESDPHDVALWDMGDGYTWDSFPFVRFGGGAQPETVICPSCWKAARDMHATDPDLDSIMPPLDDGYPTTDGRCQICEDAAS